MNTPLPPLSDPHAYIGLFVYDFGSHVSVGYTAGEIRLLRECEAHRGGTAYQIYRVDECGRIELRGVTDERLAAREAMCFLRGDGIAARADYDRLCRAAEERPLPCPAEGILGRIYEWEPPHVTAVVYPASASHQVSGWLGEVKYGGGDDVLGGMDVCRQLLAASALWIGRKPLPGKLDYADRTIEDILNTVRNTVQR
ncbi:MAG: hypothetical protein J5J06_14025 [Phycisphaerae bacterium]|nr:hypothetical protein [Phycisphaerae bacterium]